MVDNRGNKKKANSTQTFVKGALILSLSGMIVKLLSALFRVPLGNLIGDPGMGYYQTAYPIYNLLTAIATAGIPSTIAKLVAEKRVVGDYQGAKDIFTQTLKLMALIGLALTLFIFVGAPIMIQVFGWPIETRYSLWGLAMAPFFVCIMGAFKGYFQGRQNMAPVAIAQVLENLGRVGMGLILAFYFFPDLGKAAGGASFGNVVGGIAGTLLLITLYRRQSPEIEEEIKRDRTQKRQSLSFKKVAKMVLIMAIPIAIGAGAGVMINFLDSVLLIKTLTQTGTSLEIANQYVGQLGKITTFINLPLTFGMTLVVGLIPAIAEAVAKKDYEEMQKKIELGIRIAILLALPATVGLAILAKPIMNFIYAKAPEGALLLAISAVGISFMMVAQIFTGILQGLGKVWQPVIGIGLAAIVKTICNVILVATPLKINGAAMSSVMAYAVFMLYTYKVMKKYTGFKFNTLLIVIKPLIATMVMGMTTGISYYLLLRVVGNASLGRNAMMTLIGVAIGGVTYLMMIFAIKAVTKKDIQEILNKKEN